MYLKIQRIVGTLKQYTALNTKRYSELYPISQTKDVTTAAIHQPQQWKLTTVRLLPLKKE